MAENRLGLDMLTLLGMPPAEHVRLAAELGCASVSLALSGLPLERFGYPHAAFYPTWSLQNDPALRRETKAALQDTGIHVALGEGFRVRPDADLRDSGATLDIMAELGTQRISAVSMEHDLPRTYDQLAILADLVIARGMEFLVEFAPPNAINSLPSALTAIDHIGPARCRLQMDSMHFFRSGATLDDLEQLKSRDPGLLSYVQICDAPRVSREKSYMQEAMFARMMPGAGELPLRAWLAALPPEIGIGIEVPIITDLLAGVSPRDHAARVVAAARALGA
jgi:sugar phosphate isomerase/epimerase